MYQPHPVGPKQEPLHICSPASRARPSREPRQPGRGHATRTKGSGRDRQTASGDGGSHGSMLSTLLQITEFTHTKKYSSRCDYSELRCILGVRKARQCPRGHPLFLLPMSHPYFQDFLSKWWENIYYHFHSVSSKRKEANRALQRLL